MRAILSPPNPPLPGVGTARTPLHLLDGMITPSGLHFERSHSGISDIDPDQHRLVIHGHVRRPLVFTVEALQSRATDNTGMVQPTRAAFAAERGLRGVYHYNVIASWRIDEKGEATIECAGDSGALNAPQAQPLGIAAIHGLRMSMLKCLAACAAICVWVPALAQAPQFGHPITPANIAPWDISIGPDGAGLPPGSGTASQGQVVYAAKCQACHGEKGAGGPNDTLVGGMGSLAAGKSPVKTVGSYWPYATTLFDYIRRAMPFPETKSLTNEEIYAVSAYILNLNGIVGTDEVLDAQSLPKVKMPNRDGFIPFSRDQK